MFSGIIEECVEVITARERSGVVELHIARPSGFTDLRTGDSVAVDGVCLTLEKFSETDMQFALGEETLRVTQWQSRELPKKRVNLERSMRFGDRIHGHLVSGHVDSLGVVSESQASGEGHSLKVKFPEELKSFLSQKGSVAINGVSLTVNSISGDKNSEGEISMWLIPETVKRTNLSQLRAGDSVNLEIDQMARVFVNWLKEKGSFL